MSVAALAFTVREMRHALRDGARVWTRNARTSRLVEIDHAEAVAAYCGFPRHWLVRGYINGDGDVILLGTPCEITGSFFASPLPEPVQG